ncbi:MAG: vitamin K epoxide reductase family protein [Chthoniobacterales bacterium]
MKKSRSRNVVEQGARARRIILTIAAVLALAGLAETTYLTASHFAGAQVVCGNAGNCSQVLGSIYSSVHGIPLAALGALAYFVVFSSATLAASGYRKAGLALALVVSAMFVTTLWLLYLQAFVLHTFCEYCLASAAIIFILAGLVIAMPPPQEN